MSKLIAGKARESNLELYRIVLMLLIVMHHYVVNSGLMSLMEEVPSNPQSIFLYIFGMWGKIGINCFVLITGYFMCKQNITLSKFLRLVFEVWFYSFVIYIIFSFFGYYEFSIKGVLIESLKNFINLQNNFTACFIVFYLFIPFLNIFIKSLDQRQHISLILLCLLFFSILPVFKFVKIGYSYVTWFMVLYLIASYLRLYMDSFFKKLQAKIQMNQLRFWLLMSLLFVSLSVISVLAVYWIGGTHLSYRFVSDSNQILALITAVSLFMLFKNIKIKHSKLINTIAASTFGVLLIHANSNTMRQWLWRDFGNNIGQFGTPTLVLHAFGLCISVFIVCTIIDYLIKLCIEKPLFKLINRQIEKHNLGEFISKLQ